MTYQVTRVQRGSDRSFMDSKLSPAEANRSTTCTYFDASLRGTTFKGGLHKDKPRRVGSRVCRRKISVENNTGQIWHLTLSPDVWEGAPTQDFRRPQYRGTWHCFRTILMKESVSGLYRGMTSPMAGVAAVNAIVFGIYGQAQRSLPDPDCLSSHFIAGASAGIAQTPVCSPIELAKTRLQLQSPTQQRFTGPVQCLKHIYKHEGYRGVFRGFGITLLREAPSYGTYFLTYEALTRTSSDEPVSTARMLLAGGLAGTASWVISYPLDVVKSRIQAESSNRYSGAWDCFRQSIKAEGYSCLYRGLNSTILRAFPTNAATFAVVTWTFRLFDQRPNQASKSQEAEPAIVRPMGLKDTQRRGPFIGEWNNLLRDITGGSAFSRSYYSTLTTLSASALTIDNSAVWGNVQSARREIKSDATKFADPLEHRERRKRDDLEIEDADYRGRKEEWEFDKKGILESSNDVLSVPMPDT
ncbi:hypothetical protein KM043_005378 [Ampulex compressa]|nr:hypothetical protein KM043_005378 [Ampulex compressa]